MLRTELLEEELLLLGKKKIKRFTSSGISGHSKSGTTQTKLNGRGPEGCPLDPFDATDEPSGCSPSQAAIRRTMIVFNHQFGKFSHSCCVDSQTSVTRQASRQRKEPLPTEIDVNACEVRPPPAVHDCHGRRSQQTGRFCKPNFGFVFGKEEEEKELDKHSAVRSQAGGSGEGEWSRRVALHKACMGVQVHTGTRIHWDAHQTFFVPKSGGGGGGGGGSPSKFFGNTDLKKLRKLQTTP